MADIDSVLAALRESTKLKSLTPEQMLEELQSKGYQVIKKGPGEEYRGVRVVDSGSAERYEGGQRVKFAALSCTHLGSRHQQITFLNQFYDLLDREGIKTVLHAGDVSDGDGKMYRGHEYDIFVHGVDAMARYVELNYPLRVGITTHMIAGNHDMSFYKRGGADILASVAARRSDMVYHGPYGAKIMLDGVHVYLAHGKGSMSYARSYKMQRRIEQFAPQEKPEVYLLGHYHVTDHLYMYRNVFGLLQGCFQSQTDYLKENGLYPEIGGFIVTIFKGTSGADRPGGFVRMQTEFVPFYVPMEADF